MKTPFVLVLCAGLAAANAARAAIDLISLTSTWIPVLVAGQSDPTDDNQANSGDIELVGDPLNDLHAFYVKFDDSGSASATDGELAFRIRVAEDKSPAGFKGYARIGIDVNLDGVLDFFLSAELDTAVTIIEAGSGLNTGPNTSTLGATLVSDPATAANYNWSAVTDIDGTGFNSDLDGGGKTDYFLTYSIDFADLVTLASSLPGNEDFDDQSGLGYVVITSQNANNLNSDIGGVDNNNFDSSLSWPQLGAMNVPITADGSEVPEPGAYALALGFAVLVVARRRRRA